MGSKLHLTLRSLNITSSRASTEIELHAWAIRISKNWPEVRAALRHSETFTKLHLYLSDTFTLKAPFFTLNNIATLTNNTSTSENLT